jgi:hypothetical protein
VDFEIAQRKRQAVINADLDGEGAAEVTRLKQKLIKNGACRRDGG